MSVEGVQSHGYLYILEVRDIYLPVCKIGQTTRNPLQRCAEINRGSTGDFIWKVAYEIPVNDCRGLERLVHRKLELLRQKHREFFNVTAHAAYEAVKSILAEQTDFQQLDAEDEPGRKGHNLKRPNGRQGERGIFRERDTEYVTLFAQFMELTRCQGKPFGQLNQPRFGISDGKEGVQWNIAVNRETDDIQLGVNLEGKKYRNWPISTFLLSELQNPGIFDVREQLDDPNRVFVRLMRDAWQVTSRPSIIENIIGRADVSLRSIRPQLWRTMLQEGLGCLSAKKGYKGRSVQQVTLKSKPKSGERSRSMEVSSHLTIWTPLGTCETALGSMSEAIDLLQPVHDWVSRASQLEGN